MMNLEKEPDDTLVVIASLPASGWYTWGGRGEDFHAQLRFTSTGDDERVLALHIVAETEPELDRRISDIRRYARLLLSDRRALPLSEESLAAILHVVSVSSNSPNYDFRKADVARRWLREAERALYYRRREAAGHGQTVDELPIRVEAGR